MKKQLFILVLLLLFTPLRAQFSLSNESSVSLLTTYPSDEEVFTVYGHTAIRIQDPFQGIDYVFNYGIFDFKSPNFAYRFAKGETDYLLGLIDFRSYVIEYQMRGSRVDEQVLNLTDQEKNKLWQALVINYEPQNRKYRYNFFFDNCSTRPRDLIEKCIEGQVAYDKASSEETFRDLISHCTRNHTWLTFGCDLALGSPTDKFASAREKMFLPLYLEKSFETAYIISNDGKKRNLVYSSTVIIEQTAENRASGEVFSPLVAGIILFVITGGLTFWEWKRKKHCRIIDFIIFCVAGLAGSFLFFLSFISEHPCTFPNWSLLWLHPLHLVGAILFILKKTKIAAYYYHFINFAALTLLLLGWNFIPQQFNSAFIPLVFTLWMRSGFGVYRHKTNNN